MIPLAWLACAADAPSDSVDGTGVAPDLVSVEAVPGGLVARWTPGAGTLRVTGGVDTWLEVDGDETELALDDGEYRLQFEGSEVFLDQLVGDNRLVYRSQLPLPGALDVWGEGDVAVLAGGTSGVEVLVVDVSDPLAPVELARIEGDAEVRDVKLQDGVLYAGSESPPQVTLYDLADPSSPQELAVIETSAHNLSVGGGHAYVTDTLFGLQTYDVTDPSQPAWIAQGDGTPPHDVTWVDDTLYVAAVTSFAVWDVTDPADPAVLHEHPLPLDGMPSLHNIWPLGRDHVITSQEVVGGHLQVWSLTDPVVEVGRFTLGDNCVHNVYARGDVVFGAWYTDGVVALDLSDPTSPVELGHYETWVGDKPEPDDKPVILGAWGVWPYGEHIVVGDTERGLVVLDFFPRVVTPD